jgi:hypothetical protein
MRLFICVHTPLMVETVSFESELLSANGTFKTLFSRVDQHVRLKHGLCFVSFGTNNAHMRSRKGKV